MNELGTHAVDLPTPNLPLLRKVLDQITTHPETWFQEAWAVSDEYWECYKNEFLNSRCGTAQCVGGWAAEFAGYKMYFGGRGSSVETGICYLPGSSNDLRSIPAVAQEELGLTDGEAATLFAGGNSISRIRLIAHTIAGRAGEVL